MNFDAAPPGRSRGPRGLDSRLRPRHAHFAKIQTPMGTAATPHGEMDAQRAWPRRGAPCLVLVLAAILAGCGSSGSSAPTDSHSPAGVSAAARKLMAAAATGRY